MKGGLVTIPPNGSGVDVVLNPPMPNTNFIVLISIENDTNGVASASQGYYFSVDAKTAAGFRINIRNNQNGSLVTSDTGTNFSFAVVPLPN